MDIGLFSFTLTTIAFGLLALLAALSLRGQPYKIALVTASALSAVWAGIIAGGTLLDYPPVELILVAEAMRDLSWIFLLLQLASLRFDGG